MTADRDITDAERLARLEQDMQGLTGAVRALAVKVDALADTQRTPWNTLIAVAGLLLTLVAMVGSAAGYVLNEKINAIQDMGTVQVQAVANAATVNSDRISAVRADHDSLLASTSSKLQRVETQLFALSNIAAIQAENNRNWISEHHQHLYGRPLPDKKVWPIVGQDRGAHER